jgi:hypothetical protein
MPFTVGTALYRMSCTSFILSEINLTQNPIIKAYLRALQPGPALFTYNNIAAHVEPVKDTKQDHLNFQLLIGTRGSYTAAHTDFYGADAYIYLVEGTKLWFMAPPESKDAFMKIFKHNVPCSTPSKERNQEFKDADIHAIIQNAGDTVFVPGGWPHCVKNLTDTVAFGHSYIRPWNLKYTIEYLKEWGHEYADSNYNLEGIFNAVKEGDWGHMASRKSLQEAETKWENLKANWANQQ